MVKLRELNPQSAELEVTGDLTESTVAEFRAAMYAAIDQPYNQLDLNLQNVHVMNSAAIGAILLLQKKAKEQGKQVTISRCSSELQKTFDAIHLERIVSFGAR